MIISFQFKCGVKKQEEDNLKECMRYFHECYRPIEEAKRYSQNEAQRVEARILEADVFIQMCVAESKKAIQTGMLQFLS